jgi:hypothetical protein
VRLRLRIWSSRVAVAVEITVVVAAGQEDSGQAQALLFLQ